jgi:hypothetical protein
MKNFRAADKSSAGGDKKHDINFHWPKEEIFILKHHWIQTITAENLI